MGTPKKYFEYLEFGVLKVRDSVRGCVEEELTGFGNLSALSDILLHLLIEETIINSGCPNPRLELYITG